MNDQERLFAAVGGVSPDLVARSEIRRQSCWPAYCLAAAACLALVLALGRPLPEQAEFVQNDPPLLEGTQGLEDTGSIPPSQNGEVGSLRLLCYAPLTHAEVDFLIYVNEERFSIHEEDGTYRIRSLKPLSEDFPLCGLDILHLTETSPDEAQAAAKEALPDLYQEVLSEDESPAVLLLGSRYLRAGAGTNWDSPQIELWFVDDGQGGTFALISRYFLEAEEGFGGQFRDMVSSFRTIPLNETVPGWMRELYETVDQLFPALFSDDLSSVSGLLAEDADADAYGKDVWTDITVASVDYMPDDDYEPASAIVSVKHRLNQEEGDSFNYLTMELCRRDGKWLLVWSGIEK